MQRAKIAIENILFLVNEERVAKFDSSNKIILLGFSNKSAFISA